MAVDPSPSASVFPPTEETAIPLSPFPGEVPEPRPRTGLIDCVLAVLVIALGVLLASFPGGSADIWLHLATGKLLAAGAYVPGAEPFAHTTGGASWVNHAWLYDFFQYTVFRVGGGAGLVVVKAILAGLLALVMLLAGRNGGGWWAPAVCATVGLLAVGTRLPVAPVGVSYLGLALTVLLLERGGRRPAGSALAAYWPLLPLFALWANLDAWFLLGPAAVACYALGALLGRRVKAAAGLVLVLAAGLAACCINPYLVGVFRWPSELGLSEAARALRGDGPFGGLVLSPLSAAWRSSQLAAPAGWAFVALVPLGLLSFAANRAGRPWGRALLWGALLALALYQARAVPFFAVVAAPLMAINFQEAARRPAARPGPAWQATTAIKGLTAFAGLLLLVAAWPGWLQAPPHQRRAWDLEPEPSLRRAAEQVARWRHDGQLGPESHGFNFSPDSAEYFAWACPEEKGFLDARLPLFGGQVASDYEAVRQALLDESGATGDGWRDVLRRRGVDHVILYDADPNRLVPALHRLFRDEAEWPLLYADGRTAIFGWRDPSRRGEPDRFAALTFDPARAAFFPAAGERAPAAWPGRAPQPPGWLDPFVKAPPPRSLDRDEAALYLVEYDAVAPPAWHARLAAAYAGRATSALGTAATGGPIVAAVDLTLRLRLAGAEPVAAGAPRSAGALGGLARALFENELGRQGRDETALLLLAVRAARRALAANPDDATAYFLLGDAYLRMARDLPGANWGARLPMLTQLRRAQASAALNAAVLLRPDLRPAHARLASLYLEMGYLDLALKHQRAAGLNDDAARLEEEVRRRNDIYQANSGFLTDADRARAALEKGLAGTALDQLLTSDVAAFGAPGMRLELELLLATGRVAEVRDWMTEQQTQLIDHPTYAWLQARMKAATGDYADADKDLSSLLSPDVKPGQSGAAVEMRGALALAMAFVVGSGPLPDGSHALPGLLFQLYQFRVRSGAIVGALGGEADLAVLRGLLALESGQTGDAARRFREALAFWGEGDAPAAGRLDFPGRGPARTCLDWLTPPRKEAAP